MRTSLFEDPALTQAVLDELGDYGDQLVEDVARSFRLQTELADGYAAWAAEAYPAADIEVSPRYGTFDLATGLVDPPEGPATPQGDTARRALTPVGRPRVVVVGPRAGRARPADRRHARSHRRRPAPLPAHEPPPGRRRACPTPRPSTISTTAADSFDEVYGAIVEALVAAAAEHGEVLYAVPGSPVVAERAVELLVADDRVEVEVLPALSYLDLAWARLAVDPVALGARLVDGRRFATEAAGERGPLLVGQCDQPHVLSDIKLAARRRPRGRRAPAPRAARRVGAARSRGTTSTAAVEPDHLTSLWIPTLAEPVAGEVARFHELVRTLRAECPWDREQTHASLTRHLLEETYEVLEAIDHVDEEAGAGFEALEEELGDLLFQVVFHSVLAAEEGQFTLADVARGIHDKLYARHPHVFDPRPGATDIA